MKSCLVAKPVKAFRHPLSKRRQQGFILVASLWMMLILLLIAGFFAYDTEQKVQQAFVIKQRLNNEVAQQNTLQILLYRLATQRMTFAGLTTTAQTEQEYRDQEDHLILTPVGGEIHLDGTYYQGEGNSYFSLQDQAGLLSLNSVSIQWLSDVLAKFEDDYHQHQALIATLKDYIDADELLHLNGAEKPQYQKRKLPVPSNYYLRSVAELKKVYGWQQWLQNHPDFQLEAWLSIRRDSKINLNTLPVSLLPFLPGVDLKASQQIIKQRQQRPFKDLDDFILRSGITTGIAQTDQEFYRIFPSNRLKITLGSHAEQQSKSRQQQIISIQLTPIGLLGPWLIDYSYNDYALDQNLRYQNVSGRNEQTEEPGNTQQEQEKLTQDNVIHPTIIYTTEDPFFQNALPAES